MEGGIFLTIKDLMRLTGSNSYNGTGHQHRAIRDSLSIKARGKITVKAYCEHEGIDFQYVWEFLRKKKW